MSEHHGQHLDEDAGPFCEECLTFRLNWRAAGTRRKVLEAVVAEIHEEAARAFVSREDHTAKLLRDLADHFSDQEEEANSRLQWFIEEAT